MRVMSVPKAEILFTDGHIEKSVEVFMLSSKDHDLTDCIVVAQSGSYRPSRNGRDILKYHPEYMLAEIRTNGDCLYDSSGCWIPDACVKELRVWFENQTQH